VTGLSFNLVVEVLATLCGLAFIVLLIRDRVACWPFGIAGSLLSIYLFVDGKLYSEAVLYLYYVGMGIWGWLRWHQRSAEDNNPVVHYGLQANLVIVMVASLAALALGSFFAGYSDAQRPYIDAFTTTFSFAATYLEVKKVLETWVYWIVLNSVSIWLYMDRSLDIYAGLICVYAVLSFWGLWRWLQLYRTQGATLTAR
jgi:nicotinamide mononucleotide transporter